MTKPKGLSGYPTDIYSAFFRQAIRAPFNIPCENKKDAEAYRADLHAYRRALDKELVDLRRIRKEEGVEDRIRAVEDEKQFAAGAEVIIRSTMPGVSGVPWTLTIRDKAAHNKFALRGMEILEKLVRENPGGYVHNAEMRILFEGVFRDAGFDPDTGRRL